MRSTRRGRLVAGALAVAVLGGGTAVGAAVLGPDDVAPAPAPRVVAQASPVPSPTSAPDRADLLPPLEGGEVPSGSGLEAAVRAALADPALAPGLAVSVVDTADGRPLYERSAAQPLVPASTAKILTAAAALSALPPDHRLTTRVVAGTAPGEVVLVGGGDPTLAGPRAPVTVPALARLDDLARQVRAALGATVVQRVLVDESLWSGARLGPGWKPTYVTEGAVAPVGPLQVDAGRVRPGRSSRVADPALAAGRALADLLQPGRAVTVARGTAGGGARALGTVRSPPVPTLVERMLTRSDNDLAEALARAVALEREQPASFAGAATATREVLSGLLEQAGAGQGSARLVDGSGLSRADRLQPQALTRVLALAASGDEPRLAPLLSGLPVAGFDGTLATRYSRPDARAAAGVVRAKTGTLDGVSALAGLVRTVDGRLLAFDVTATAVPLGANRRAERALDALAARFAACGCP